MNFTTLLDKILSRENLHGNEASWLMQQIMTGSLSAVQTSACLSGLRAKGETPEEIAAFAGTMREFATPLPFNTETKPRHLADTCGTGGDQSHLFNLSTLVAMTIASLGHKVVKHGNRAVSSHSGSADILEKLGYPLSEPANQAAERVLNTNFAFLFAPAYHPAMKHVAPVRKELGVRTIFNILGPLANPAAADVQLLGVYHSSLLPVMAEVLKLLGVTSALVVHSRDGLDEISPAAVTDYALLHHGVITRGEINPAELPLKSRILAPLKVQSANESLEKVQGVLDGKFSEGIEAVALNAAALLYLLNSEPVKTNQGLMATLAGEISSVSEYLASGKVATLVSTWKT